MRARPAVYMDDRVLITLTKGKVAVVGPEDAELARMNWYATFSCGHWYAVRRTETEVIYMHRLVAARAGLDITGAEVDHVDLDGLNNLRTNLRRSTHSENKYNRNARKDNKSGHKGVCWYRGKWLAQIVADRKYYRLGTFDDLEDAAAAYREAAIRLHGEFARTS